jgi:hypothetical protein
MERPGPELLATQQYTQLSLGNLIEGREGGSHNVTTQQYILLSIAEQNTR